MSDAAACHYCGDTFFTIQTAWRGYGEDLLVILCPTCGQQLIPVKMPSYANTQERSNACLKAWNDHMAEMKEFSESFSESTDSGGPNRS